AWATERRDVLSGPFFVLTVLAYVRMAGARRLGRPWRRCFVASLGCYLLSLLAKASGMMLPIVLLVLDTYPLRRFGRESRGRAALEKLPYAALAGAAALIALRGQAALSGMRPLAGYGVLDRIAQAAYGLCFYPWKSVAPVGLSALYLLPRRLDPAALGVLGVLTARQTATWRDSFTLFGQMLAVDPTNHVALAKRGWLRQQRGDLDGAQADYSEGIRHHPDAILYFNRATLEYLRR